MLDIYICEDKEELLDLTSSFVKEFCIIQNLDGSLVLATPNPKEVLQHYKNNQNPALFFLDIDLGSEMNGIELARSIREQGRRSFIVFVTTHSEMAFLTFQYKVEALDFIIKDAPGSLKERIASCIVTAMERHQERDSAKIIQVKIDEKVILLEMEEIIYIETTHIRHKLRLHTKSRCLEFSGELKGMEKQLDDRFIRCHKSYLINKDKVDSINKKENTATMSNGGELPISRTGKKLLL